MHAASPWAGLVEANPPPAWKGSTRMVELLSRGDEPAAIAPPARPKVQRVAAVSRRRDLVVRSSTRCMAILLPEIEAGPRTRCVPWAPLQPGTDTERELLARLGASWPLLHA